MQSMSSISRRTTAQSHSQLLAEDPDEFVQRLKRRLALKEGIPEGQQRLIFSVSTNRGCTAAPAAEKAADEIVKELHSWQAILYQDDRAIGRLLQPHLSAQEIHSTGVIQTELPETKGIAVEFISIQYKCWQAARARQEQQPKQLCLPVDKAFTESSYRIQVIGRSKGRSFVVPISYTFEGSKVAQALDIEVQRAEYIKKHQLARGQIGSSPQLLSSVPINCGEGLGGFLTIFNAEAQPAWLESIALQFSVVASKILDEAAPHCAQHPMSGIQSHIAKATHEKSTSPTRKEEQENRDSWLPKLVGPAPTTGKKSKTKQKGRKGRQPEEAKSTGTLSQADKGSPQLPAASPAEVIEASGQGTSWPVVDSGAEGGFPASAPNAEGTEITGSSAGAKAGPVPIATHAKLGQGSEVMPEGGSLPHLETFGPRVPPPAVHMSRAATSQLGPGQGPAPAVSQGLGALGSSTQDPAVQLPAKAQQASLPARKGSGGIMTGRPSLVAAHSEANPLSIPVSDAIGAWANKQMQAGEAGSSRTAARPASRLKRAEIMTTTKTEPGPGTRSDEADDASPAHGAPAESTPANAAHLEEPDPPAQTGCSRHEESQAAQMRSKMASVTGDAGGTERRQPDHEDVDMPRMTQQDETSSSDGSLQTAFSDLGANSPGAEARPNHQPFGPLLRAGNSGAHSSTGASFRTYGSADSGRSAMALDEDNLASSLPGPYQIPDEEAFGPARALIHSASAPAPGVPPQSPQIGHHQNPLLDYMNAQVHTGGQIPIPLSGAAHGHFSLEDLHAENLRLLDLYRGNHYEAGRGASNGNVDGRENQHPCLSPKEESMENGCLQQQPQWDPLQLAGSGPPAAPLLRPRSHSSADLTSQGSSSALPSASSTGVGLAAGAQRAPPRGSQLAGPTAAGFSDNSTDPALDFDLPNGHPAGAEDQDSEKVADADKRWQRPTYRLPGSEMLPVSATYAPYGGPGGGRTWSQDSQGDSGNRAFLAELQMEMAARGSLEGARPSRSGFMTPPPPPPPRTPPLGAMYPSTGSIERQGSFQVPQPSQSTIFDSHGQPSCDLERLLSCVTPVLMLNGQPATGETDGQTACLGDVWSFFEEASAYGREIYTRNGRRGPALAYYTPFLSAVRAFLPGRDPDRREQGSATYVRPLVHHFEADPPFNREPLAGAVQRTLADPLSGLEENAWHTTRLSELHPASWFAVAWYPIYRIPDAPLAAKFLTYHSLLPKPSSQTHFGVTGMGRTVASAPNSVEHSPLCFPILGLKCAEQRGEPWLEMYDQAPGPRMEWEHRLWQLQKNADSLSAGRQLRVLNAKGDWEQPHQTHADLDWFNRHP